MKNIFSVVFFIAISLVVVSCQDRKTYADHLKDEQKAIEQFITKNNIVVLQRYPAKGVFAENEFYKDPENGVYFNVVSYGDTSANPKLNEEIYVRFSGLKYIKVDDSTTYSNMDPNVSPWPSTFKFLGPVGPMNRDYYDTPGWVVPLMSVGHNGIVKMIVPFNMGSPTDRSSFQPTYYDHVEYRFSSRI
ncbi:MAG: DUF4827 family protein [Fermentimonas sp.]|jgi:hypothetical protein